MSFIVTVVSIQDFFRHWYKMLAPFCKFDVIVICTTVKRGEGIKQFWDWVPLFSNEGSPRR